MSVYTNWDAYYERPYKTATITRKITGQLLLKYMKRFSACNNLTIAEIGGANSCFYEMLNRNLSIEKYIIIDNNQKGLNKFSERIPDNSNTELHNESVLHSEQTIPADITYSVGLIEHFSEENTKKAIQYHFQNVKKGGIVIITFPTPTILYRITRKISEMLGLWIFHDERPLKFEEVTETIRQYGDILAQKINWPIFLTQGIVVVKKR